MAEKLQKKMIASHQAHLFIVSNAYRKSFMQPKQTKQKRRHTRMHIHSFWKLFHFDVYN